MSKEEVDPDQVAVFDQGNNYWPKLRAKVTVEVNRN